MPKLPPSPAHRWWAGYGGTGKCQMNVKDQNPKTAIGFSASKWLSWQKA